jgi:hypothetical protein
VKNKPPIPVLVLACLYIAIGAIGFVAHFRYSLANPRDGIWIELTEFLAIIAGVFMLLGRNWARWLALAWIAFHVILSIRQPANLVMHALMCVAIAWILFNPAATRYFREARMEPT